MLCRSIRWVLFWATIFGTTAAAAAPGAPKPSWIPVSFVAPRHLAPVTADAVSLRAAAEFATRRRTTVFHEKCKINYNRLFTKVAFHGPELELRLLKRYLSAYALVGGRIHHEKGVGEGDHQTDFKLEKLLAGLKLALPWSMFRGALGLGVGTANVDTDGFKIDSLTLRPWLSLAARFRWLVLGGYARGTFVYSSDSAMLDRELGWVDGSVWVAVTLGQWTAVQAEVNARHLITDNKPTAEAFGWWDDDDPTAINGHLGVRFGSRVFGLGLSAFLPLSNRDGRFDLGLTTDLSVKF